MLDKIIKFIHQGRVYFFIFISVAFLFVLGLSPVQLSKFIGSKLGQAVGMGVGVVENPFNKLALQLEEKADRLNAREQELDAREEALLEPNKKQDLLILILGVGVLLLFVLIMTNFYLDWRRRQKTFQNKPR